jgi:hypothetical protein
MAAASHRGLRRRPAQVSDGFSGLRYFPGPIQHRQLDCKPGELLTDVIVAKIIEHANAGEIDPDRLCSRVVLELRNQPKSKGK